MTPERALLDLLEYVRNNDVFDVFHDGKPVCSEDLVGLIVRGLASLPSAVQKRESPFVTHRALVMGHYSTAAWLRQVVLSLWNGSLHPARLDRIGGCDAQHRAAALDMIESYGRNGENDPDFLQLAQDVRAREQADAEARKG